MQRKRVLFIGGLHFFVDIYSGFFAIYLVIAGLDPIKAALISSICSLIGNGAQPLLGYFADRVRGKLPVFLGVLIGALCMSAIGLSKNYVILFFLVLMGRLGISLFHPAGSNISGAAGKERRDRGFSVFIFIGTVGFALAQPYFSGFTQILGDRGSIFLALPAVILAFVYLAFSRMEISGPTSQLDLKKAVSIFRQRFGPIFLLFLIMVFRHGFLMTVVFFIAKVFADWGFDRLTYSVAGTFYVLAGAFAILTAGYIAHRIKARNLILISLLGFLPFFALLIFTGNRGFVWLAFGSLTAMGFLIHLSHVPIIMTGHRMVPEMTSTISGILMGFAWSIGNLAQPVVAGLSDIFPWAPGMMSGIVVLAVLPVIAAVLTLFLQKAIDKFPASSGT